MKKWFKKAAAISLTAAMTAGLCACGGGDAGQGGSGSGKGDTSNAELAKENVYHLQEFEVPQIVDLQNGYLDVYSAVHRDGNVWIVMGVTDWSNGDSTEVKILTMKEDGSGQQLVTLEAPDADNAQEGEPDSDNVQEEPDLPEGESQITSSAEEEADANAEEAASYVWESDSYSNFCITSEDLVIGLRSHYLEDGSDPENYISENHIYLCCWSLDGGLKWQQEMGDLENSDEKYLYVSRIMPKKSGGASVLICGDEYYKISVDADGAMGEREALSEDLEKILNTLSQMVTRQDGSLILLYSDENDWQKQFIVTYDPETNTLGQTAELPASMAYNGYRILTGGADSDLVFSTETGVYTYNIGDTEISKKMDFVNSDVSIGNFYAIVELSASSFLSIYGDAVSGNDDYNVKGGLFTYVDPADIPDKSVIVMGGNYINSNLRQRVTEYNRSSDTYRIVLREYDSYNNYEDYSAGWTKLNNDIITGNMPDILIADNLPIENYISKGLLADIGKLISEDEELSQVEFLQNVFDAYSVNGTLYCVVPSFGVNTMIAKTSLVGDGSDWNMEKMQQVLAQMDEGTQAMGDLTQAGFMGTAMSYCGNEFVDPATGKCSFNTDNFIAMMEFAKTLPEEINWDELYQDEDYWSNYDSQYRDNRTLLCQVYIGSGQGLNYQLNGSFGEPVTFVGFPTENGKGAYISPSEMYALSAKSKNLQGAWEFIRYYLTNEYQEALPWGLSVNKQICTQQLQDGVKKSYYTDENGNEVEYDDYMMINGEEIVVPPLSQEQVDQVRDYVFSVDRAYYYNENVTNIVNEEMGAFYTGQKSAKEVADTIQNRVQLYVDENR